MKKTVKGFLIAVSAAVVLALVATVTLSVMTFMKVSAIGTAPAAAGPEEGSGGEDNIVIGGSYTIRSTTAISDAYRSGDSTGLSTRDLETLEMATAVLDEVITDSMTPLEQEQAVFLWIHEHVGFDSDVTVLVRTDITTDNPHGVLSSRRAVCVGYATTFRLFMQMLDIPCMVVHDSSLIHSWDLVQIDGHWYHTDLYSADSSADPLVYLNRPDVIQANTGYGWDTSFYPAADSLDACYLYRQAVKADGIEAVPGAVKDAIDAHRPLAALLIPAEGYDRALGEYLLNQLETSLMGSVEYQGYEITHQQVITDDGETLVAVMIQDYNDFDGDDDGDGPTEEDMERVDRAIRDAFGELTDLAYDDYDGYY